MARLTSQEKFTDYILRKLGAPVIQINVDPEQVEDAIEDAIEVFCERHHEGYMEAHYAVEVTEEIATTREIKIPQEACINSVVEVISNPSKIGSWHTPQWQIANMTLNGGVASYGALDLSDFVSLRQRIDTLDEVLGKRFPFEYNRHKSLIRCKFKLDVGSMIAFQVYERVDPREEGNEWTWNNDWLKNYATALVKERWANVLVKTQGIALPGGITLDGTSMLQEAKAEIDQLEADLLSKHQAPIMPFIG